MKTRPSRVGASMVLLALVLGACGDDGGDAGADRSDAAATSPDEPNDGASPEDGAGEDGGEDGVTEPDSPSGSLPLVVEVDGRTYEFEPLACDVADNGSLVGSGRSPGGGYDSEAGRSTGVFLEFRIQPEGSPNQEQMASGERHFVMVADSDEDLTWNAGQNPLPYTVTFEDSYIDTWSLEGISASGTANFVEEGSAPNNQRDSELVRRQGTFEFNCS